MKNHSKLFLLIFTGSLLALTTSASAQWAGYGGGYYGGYGPRNYGYGGGYGGWDGRDWHGGRWGHDGGEHGDWDGRDWHGGRWGHDD